MSNSKRVLFDKYETVILFDFYLKTLNKEMTHHIAVKRCSRLLRNMAKNKDKDIDDSFRSKSGIAYQMSCMDAVYQGKMAKPTLFADIVYMYRNDSQKFEKLLKEAKSMSENGNETKENVISTFSLSKEKGTNIFEKVDNGIVQTANLDFYGWLVECQKLALPTARSYSSAINTLDMFCRENHIGTGQVKYANSENELQENIRLLLSNVEFQSNNASQHNRLTAALKKYSDYVAAYWNKTDNDAFQSEQNGTLANSEEVSRIRITLKEPRFEYGFRNDSLEISRFRESYYAVNGISCTLDDTDLVQAIKSMGFTFEGKTYLISEEEKSQIKETVEESKRQGINIIYYSSLYDINFDEYDAEKINSADMLKAVISNLLPTYHYRNHYFTFTEKRVNEVDLIHDDILRVWGSSLLQTFDDLSNKLPLIPYYKIKMALSQNADFVRNSPETYVCRNRILITQDELAEIVESVEDEIRANGRALLDSLPLKTLRAENSQVSDTAIYTAVYKLIDDKYDRNDKVLTRKGERKDIYTAVIEYCSTTDKCTYKRLEALAKQVSGVIKQPAIVEAANNAMVRVDKDNFVADKFVDFDVIEIDNALNQTIKKDFIGLKEITTFVNFPFCGYGWNLYLLESYCRRFSQRYMYETRRANSSNSGAIVRKNCFLSYHDIMAHAVARTKIKLQADDVFDYLTEAGYMERKRYRDIDSLISEAMELRNREE